MEGSGKVVNPGPLIKCPYPVDCEMAARTQPGTSPLHNSPSTGLGKEESSSFLGYVTEYKEEVTAHFSPISVQSVPL